MIDSGIQGLYTSSASAQRLNICNTGGFYPNQNEGNNFVRDRRIPHSGSWLGSESGSRSRSGSVLKRSGSGSRLGSGSVLGSGSKMALNQDQKDEEMIMILNKTKDALTE